MDDLPHRRLARSYRTVARRGDRAAAAILADQLAHIHEQRPATIVETDQLRTLRIYAAS